MKILDITKVLISTSAIFGIGVLWFHFNLQVLDTVCDLSEAIFYDTDTETD